MTTPPEHSILTQPGPGPDRTGSYGPAAHQVYDVFAPAPTEGPATPWVVLVHGGFWRAQWDRTHLRPLAAALAGQGYGVALIEYVRSGMPGGGWPATGDDVAAALAAVREQEAAGSPVVLVGHSAGGHLALWALHRPEAAGVAGAVSLAGCLDLHLVAGLGLDDDAAVDLMGGPPSADPATWAGADPARLGRTPYPVVVVHGDRDELVPLQVSRSWWERSGTPGRDRLVVLEGVTHFPLVDPRAPAFTVLRQALATLLRPG